MGARALRAMRLTVFALLASGVLLKSPAGRGMPDEVTTFPDVESVQGAGIWERAFCLGCATSLYAAGGLTIGGLATLAVIYPEAIAGCIYICVEAF